MDVSTVISRALSALGKGTEYKSPGSMPAFSAYAWPSKAKNDCSGFVSWCLRFSQNRKVQHPLYVSTNGGWFETTAIHRDGLSSTGYFTQIDSGQPGALLVYPDRKGHDGHVGIVVDSKGKGVGGVTKVIHCSLGNYPNTRDAIQLTGPDAWLARKDSIIVWLEGLRADL